MPPDGPGVVFVDVEKQPEGVGRIYRFRHWFTKPVGSEASRAPNERSGGGGAVFAVMVQFFWHAGPASGRKVIKHPC
jgi:hypothetical protein